MDAEQPPSTTQPSTILNEDPFRNENTQRLFEAIDELRSCGANQEIDLPELVIVGDQSAGKSSLLQSLTDIPFPVADRLCTRFPTRIVSRRTPKQSGVTKISIEPKVFDWTGTLSAEKVADRAERLEAYSKFGHTSPHLTSDSFKDVVEEAKELMDIKRSTSTEEGLKSTGRRNFSSDVLKVEISGPDRSYFSILDVPGIFQSLTKDLTSQEKDGVRSMVASYMKPKQSVIICVASGTNDLANQAAFDMASQHDPQLERTIGVITKCDITQHKDQILALAQNEEKHLNHGWFVVRNRTPPELESNISSLERQRREEAFFDEGPWNRLSQARRGTQALKRYLADLLCSRIQETFPTILATVQGRQEMAAAQLNKLGPSRGTTEEKRVYLTELAQQLYDLTSQAVRGRYHALGDESLKLRRFVREANDAFASKMIHHGYSVPFHTTSVAFQANSDMRQKADTTKASAASGTFNSDGSVKSGFAGFGSTTAATKVRPKSPSTIGVEFEPWQSLDDPTAFFQNIYISDLFRNFSPEELRLNDYLQTPPFSLSGSSLPTGTPKPNSIFGHAPSSSKPGNGPSLFDSNAPSNVSGQPSKPNEGLFSSSNSVRSSGFGQPLKSGEGLFGSSNTVPGSGFGQPLKSGEGLFSSSNTVPGSGFGQPSKSGEGLFSSSNTVPGSGFGQPSKSAEGFFVPMAGNTGTSSKTAAAAPLSSSAATSASSKLSFGNLGDSQSSRIYTWIREEIKNCRGTELQGTLNPDVLPALFHRQVVKWEEIASSHFQSVAKITATVVEQAARTSCGDKFTAGYIQELVQQTNKTFEKRGIAHIHRRFDATVTRHLQTQNPIFESSIRDARLARFKEALERYRLKKRESVLLGLPDDGVSVVIDLRDVTSLFDELHMSNAQNLEAEIHDTLKSYYELALQDFIGFVTQQVVESYLNDPKGPVLFFNPTYIGSLDAKDIDDLGAEDPAMVKERTELQAQVARLKRAEEIALKYS
ncbi:MAG: hypothetical protein LQ341_005770 [Variospora aurantia]|nr:MAG: hypothetical protein LQ341_005770 [Variospora aurantia]